MLVVAGAVTLSYGPQIRSWVSHLRGSPTHTSPLEPFPPGGEPALRIAVAGDVGYANDRVDRTARAIAAASASWHHFVDLNVFADHLLLRAVNQDGRVFDEAAIPLGFAPVPAPVAAAVSSGR